MVVPQELTPEVWAALPPAVAALLAWQGEQIRILTQRVAELEARFGKDSTNSSLPPSATHPHAKPPRPQPKARRRPGGQPGHQQHRRALLPTEQCQQVVRCVPTACRRCGRGLTGTDPQPLRHQVWELPDFQPSVTEYQQHRLVCACGCSTCGPLPTGVPSGQAGPRLIAFAGLLMACFRQSKRRAALPEPDPQPACAAGWLVVLQNRCAEAVRPAYDELARQLPHGSVLHLDESPTKQGQAKAWVWVFVAATFTYFACRTSRGAEVPQQVLGATFDGVIHCDRARMYWALGGRLQWCWAHLKRDFQALCDGPCRVGKRLGHDLLRPTNQLFALWQKVRDGTLSRCAFQKQMRPLRAQVEAYLLRGYFDARVAGFCKELWEYRDRLWTFVEVAGVQPTNNAAEQPLRHAVIWRKLSFGTQSAAGSRFVERLLTVVETCRRQKRNTFTWLTEAVRAHHNHQPTPSLLLGA